MRKTWIWLLWIIPLACITAQWSDPVVISDGFSPDFAIDPNTGHLHVVAILDGVIYTETDETGHIITPSQVIWNTGVLEQPWLSIKPDFLTCVSGCRKATTIMISTIHVKLYPAG